MKPKAVTKVGETYTWPFANSIYDTLKELARMLLSTENKLYLIAVTSIVVLAATQTSAVAEPINWATISEPVTIRLSSDEHDRALEEYISSVRPDGFGETIENDTLWWSDNSVLFVQPLAFGEIIENMGGFESEKFQELGVIKTLEYFSMVTGKKISVLPIVDVTRYESIKQVLDNHHQKQTIFLQLQRFDYVLEERYKQVQQGRLDEEVLHNADRQNQIDRNIDYLVGGTSYVEQRYQFSGEVSTVFNFAWRSDCYANVVSSNSSILSVTLHIYEQLNPPLYKECFFELFTRSMGLFSLPIDWSNTDLQELKRKVALLLYVHDEVRFVQDCKNLTSKTYATDPSTIGEALTRVTQSGLDTEHVRSIDRNCNSEMD